ncbi:hypothetical protein [Candidatus Mycoplasma haematominutum]|uniref:Lipoprotein n=1 Tax=Candidatus Mycoplasma haematominutum 'Birmingham 1' TaxID=1116213 RepID=G8C3N6_9MOLU|nr:hypothetical protein [Candidatus Mycoplasma haematominutum]CCE66934.1 hypothetical protein MHM_04160 [Candidatus Mycoplasma haematominutum 'Birmingham 1']
MISAKTLLYIAGAAGGCCAIGVPATWSTVGKNRIKLTKCEDSSSQSPISLDKVLQGAFCWKLDTASQEEAGEESETVQTSSSQHDTLLTNLFSSIFSNGAVSANNWSEKR